MPKNRVTGAALVLAASLIACEEKPDLPPPAPPPPAATDLAKLGVDAAILDDSTDPPAPAGDLKTELDRFVNVDACVKERSKLDPLVGDALNALGYDTFLRDACRLLEAARDKKRESCDRIDSSALRSRCQSWVAMLSQTPDACPLQFEGLVTRGRLPSCVAVAARDPRLCSGEGRSAQRATCDALVARDPAKCQNLMGGQRGQCEREVARWRSVLSDPLAALDKLPQARGKLVLHGASGTPDPPESTVDLASDFARGVVVVTAGGPAPSSPAMGGAPRMRIELGSVAESEARRIAAPPQKKTRLGLALLLDPKPSAKGKDELQATIQKLEIELPGAAPIVSPPASCDCKVTAKASAQRGGEVVVNIEGTLSAAGVRYQLALDVATFVRDVVADQLEGRVLPPVHPTLPSRSLRDAALSEPGSLR